MSNFGLSSGSEFLRTAAQKFFQDTYEVGSVKIDSEFNPQLNWKPGLSFVLNGHVHIFAEPSEEIYPKIFSLRHADILQFPEPIAIYCVCPEASALKPENQPDVKRLEDHGFGLISVNSEGLGRRRIIALPLVQVISRNEFKTLIKPLAKKQKQKVALAFEAYNANPAIGVTNLSEMVEGMARKAIQESFNKGFISKSEATGSIANGLDAMNNSSHCISARAGIGGFRSYMSYVRNISHHWPMNKKKAHAKYCHCRHAFLDGLKKAGDFREAIKNIGLTGNLPLN